MSLYRNSEKWFHIEVRVLLPAKYSNYSDKYVPAWGLNDFQLLTSALKTRPFWLKEDDQRVKDYFSAVRSLDEVTEAINLKVVSSNNCFIRSYMDAHMTREHNFKQMAVKVNDAHCAKKFKGIQKNTRLVYELIPQR